MNNVERMKQLIDQLNVYRNEYYNNSNSLISDYEYDQLFDELIKLEKETGIYMSNSPTQTVGYEVISELNKIKHSHPMLSLSKTKSIEDLKKFADNKYCLLSLKMDGLTILLTYENGELIQAETRGNGEEGEIVTHNAKVFDNIPLHIDYKGHLEIEGEAIIKINDFECINTPLVEKAKREATEKGLKGEEFEKYVKKNSFANSRNLASGSVRQSDSKIAAQRHLKFVAWKVPKIEDNFDSDNSFIFRFDFINKLGFDIVPFVPYINSSDNELVPLDELIKIMEQRAKENDYPIDGLVMTYNDISYGESLGITGHHPRHSIAFKFYDEESETVLKNIEWTMGKTGSLCPTAVFEPVEIEGTTVERASLHNVSIMKSFELSYNDTITVYKANMIIPQLRDNITRNKDNLISIPTKCPICGSNTEIIKEKDTEVLMCTNPDCQGKLLGKLLHFVSKNAINIEGMSEATLQFIYDKGWVKSFKDLYTIPFIEETYKEWIKTPGYGKKSVDKLKQSIEKSRNTTLHRFIYAQSIPLIGRTASKDIEKYCNYSIDRFCEIMSNENKIQFLSIEGFGKARLDSLENWCNNHWIEFLELKNEFVFEESVETNHDNSADLSGKVFVITGSLEHFENRDKLKERIESLGGKVSGSVSTKTTALINNDINSSSSKNKKAKELKIPIWTEDMFVQEYNLL